MRRSGRSTRIIDRAIQDLFNNGKVTLEDHYFGENILDHVRANRYIFHTFIKRLTIEHGSWNKFKIDEVKFTITLIKDGTNN